LRKKYPLYLYISSFFLFLIAVILLIQIFLRNYTKINLQWAEEAVIILFIWSVFLGASGVLKLKEHLVVSIYKSKYSSNINKIVSLIFFLALIYFGFIYFFNSLKISFSTINISLGILTFCIPFFGLITLYENYKK